MSQSEPRAGASQLKARAAVEALRLGVVNSHVAQSITYGRDLEIQTIERTIEQKKQGSCQIVVGEYGSGKSHLCEVLAPRLELAGFAVARLELGSSHSRAEHPDTFLAAVARSISLRIKGRRFSGTTEVGAFLLAAEKPGTFSGLKIRLADIHRDLPGPKNLLNRISAIQEAYWKLAAEYPYFWDERRLFRPIPSAMTAANMAVSQVNRLAHRLHDLGVSGIVILIDEAERGDWAWNTYRVDRAYNLMQGLALASTNRRTDHLKHYRNETSQAYRPLKPSLLHSVFWFAHRLGNARRIAQDGGIRPVELESLGREAKKGIHQRVVRLYRTAYRSDVSLGPREREIVQGTWDNTETRGYIRTLVAGLDHSRLNPNGQ